MSSPPETETGPSRSVGAGLALGLTAYGWWGVVMPVFFHALNAADAMELLTHRVIFGLPLLVILVGVRGRFGELRRVIRSWRSARVLIATALLVGINWYLFVYAVVNDLLLEVSLGYYINPLVSVALGFIFLKERPRALGWVAILMAVGAVVFLAIGIGLPWISITVALTFGFYGLLRKKADFDSVTGMTVEMMVLLPFMLGLSAWLTAHDQTIFGKGDPSTTALMTLGGLVTIVPLLCFTASTRRLQLTTVALLQYLTPTGHFLMGLYYGEAFDGDRAIAFGVIWAALALFTFDSIRHHRRQRTVELVE